MKQIVILLSAGLLLFIIGCNPKNDKQPNEAIKKQNTEQSASDKSDKKDTKTEKPTADKVEVQLFVMSKCPYGVQAIDAATTMVKNLKGAVDLKIDYIGGTNEDGSFDSLHGEEEINGNIAQLCAEKVAPEKHHSFLNCMNATWREIPKNWESCAKADNIDVAKLKDCYEGEMGKTLLLESFKRADKAQAKGSPSFIINGKEYNGNRMSQGLVKHICDTYNLKQCSDTPKPPEVLVTVLTDKRCGKDCDPTPLFESLEQAFLGLKPQVLQWEDPKAQELAKKLEITKLPAVIFDKSVEKDADGLMQLIKWLEEKGDYYLLRVEPMFDPEAEICDNKKDDTNNGLVDCADPDCKEQLICRKNDPGHLEVFVMSQCPYGAMAIMAMEEILKTFGDELKFSVHYLADEQDGKFDSLHGQPEVDENIRQLCAIKHYDKDKKYMDYLLCRSQDYQNNEWKGCTGKNGIATDIIEKCATGKEGTALLSADIKVGGKLEISGSPTWIINGQTKFQGIDPADIQKNICDKNPDFKGCSVKLEAKTDAHQHAPHGSCGG